jgi:predicted deacylase
MSRRPEGDEGAPLIRPAPEEARRVALDRLVELERWIDKARTHAVTSTLYELETDFQVIEELAGITAQQILRVLRESGLLRDAAHGLEDQRPDEIREQRDRHTGE